MKNRDFEVGEGLREEGLSAFHPVILIPVSGWEVKEEGGREREREMRADATFNFSGTRSVLGRESSRREFSSLPPCSLHEGFRVFSSSFQLPASLKGIPN